jgi:histidyl-tRNA synthetase
VAHGPLDADKKKRILAFLKIKGLAELETVLGSFSSEKIATRLADWRKVLAGLASMGLGDFIAVDLSVVRGLAYYTGFVFEALDRKGDLRALAGGGRYNDLVKKLGGPDLPAVGFAIGDVTTGLLLEQRGLTPAFTNVPDVYVVIGGENERRAAFADVHKLRAAGFRVEYPFKDLAFGKQFKIAAESGAKLALIYGGDELAKGAVKIRNMVDRSEREVAREEVAAAVRDSLAGD